MVLDRVPGVNLYIGGYVCGPFPRLHRDACNPQTLIDG